MSDPSRKVDKKRQCTRKRAFHTEKDARSAAESYRRSHGERMDVYLCKIGKKRHWHIGHSELIHQRMERIFNEVGVRDELPDV